MSKSRARQSKLRLNARLIREKDRARASELRRVLLCGALIVIPLLGYVWQRVDFIRNSRDVEALQNRKQMMQEANNEMTIERALLLSPERIERVAREQLGLIDPPPENVRRVRMLDGRINGPDGPIARDGRRLNAADKIMTAGVGGVLRPDPPGDRR